MPEKEETNGFLILGDLAWPDSRVPSILGLPRDGVRVLVNLEGALLGDPMSRGLAQRTWCGVSNHPDMVRFLHEIGTAAVCLGNNHVMDFAGGLEETTRLLADAGLQAFGAGLDLAQACRPLILSLHGSEVDWAFFSGAELMTNAAFAGDSTAGVASLESEQFLETIRTHRENHPSHRIVVIPHWGYEGCEWPSPIQRILAERMTMAGADLIVGHHPHLIQGSESIGTTRVVYSLGNFAFAQTQFRGSTIRFPEKCRRGNAAFVSATGLHLVPIKNTFGESVEIAWDLMEAAQDATEEDWRRPDTSRRRYASRFRKAMQVPWRYPVFTGVEPRWLRHAKVAQLDLLRWLMWAMNR